MSDYIDVFCRNCGKCCIIPLTGKPCKHLVRLKSGKTLCRVYKTRLGRKIAEDTICILREQSTQDYEGCSFNKNKEED